ncbi:MAG: cell division protein ZapA [Gemmatimonadota bacterium]
MSEERRAVRVTIFGDEYAIRSDMDEEYTRACARYVDEAIQSAHVQSHVAEPHKAAILAALEITDQLFQLRAETSQRDEDLDERMAALHERVQEVLET